MVHTTYFSKLQHAKPCLRASGTALEQPVNRMACTTAWLPSSSPCLRTAAPQLGISGTCTDAAAGWGEHFSSHTGSQVDDAERAGPKTDSTMAPTHVSAAMRT